MPAVAEKAPETVEEKPPYRVAWFKKPRMDAHVVDRFREMLRIPEEDDLPESLLLLLCTHAAINGHFAEANISNDMYVQMVMDADLHAAVRGIPRMPEGTPVYIKSLALHGVYVCSGVLERDLINCNGRFFVMPANDVERVTESDLDPRDANSVRQLSSSN